MPSSPKSRVSYDKQLRADAKAAGQGLITISVTQPNGERLEYQVRGNARACRFAKWAGAMLGAPEAQPCLESIMRKHLSTESEEGYDSDT